MLKQLILDNWLFFTITITITIFFFAWKTFRKFLFNYKESSNLIGNIFLSIFVLGVLLIISSFSWVLVLYKYIYSFFGFAWDAPIIILLLLIGVLIIYLIKLRLEIIKLNRNIINIDHKLALDNNSQEYKQRREKIYRSQ